MIFQLASKYQTNFHVSVEWFVELKVAVSVMMLSFPYKKG